MSLESLITTKERYNETLFDISYGKLKLIIPVIALVTVIFSGYHDAKEFQHNIETNNRFICKSTMDDSFTVVVDKQDGWILKDKYFIKGNNTISQKRCTPLKESNNE